MSWSDLALKIETALRATGYVHSVYEGDVYDIWNNSEVQYVSACYDEVSLTQESGDGLDTYNVMVYVADRLTEDNSNSRQARDFAYAVLKMAVATLRQYQPIAVSHSDFTPFVQKFADNLAGYYTQLSITVPSDIQNC